MTSLVSESQKKEKSQLIETERRKVVARDWEEEGGENKEKIVKRVRMFSYKMTRV